MTGPEIRAAREAAGLTQAALAARLGVAQPRVAEWESGRVAPSAAALAGIRAALCGDGWAPCDEPAEDEYPRMEVRPRDAGQIVERSYGVWGDWEYRRTEDRSIVGHGRVAWARRALD